MAAQQPRRKKADLLKEALAGSSGSLAELQAIAVSLNLMEDRYMARPAAELLVEHGDAASADIAMGLAATPVLGRDPNGDLLRAAFKRAMANEGIPPKVDRLARTFYGERSHVKPQTAVAPMNPDPEASSYDGIMGMIRRLFGG
jgi:DNA-binding LacI/PurR family transcriptional regulator